ncbi:CHAP domain-containing protein [Dorea formicigenerans]|uniref:CD1108 family mobile element protein n=1 Tax=Dorea formicigenerans TaxID=39486 RepID=UPI0015701129|nr:CHAP domain-containing protein [Dorea formicigenerans]NSE46319.1 CHAP domain-containing protein [Dorea formicigenerans]
MSRDGLIEVNETKETAERISRREQEADFSKQPEQAAQDTAAQLTSPGTFPKNDTGKTERVMEHIGAVQTRQASKNAVRRAQEEAAANVKTSRLQFTAEELSNPELEAYIRKSQKAADNLDAARAALPKEKVLVKERVFDEAKGKGKTRLHFEEREKPMPNGKHHKNPLSRPAQEAGIFVHNKIHAVEKDNSGVEGAHKTEEVTERGAKYGARKIREGYHRHKLKPYRAAAKAEKAAFKANVEFQYQKLLQENPQLAASNPLSRYWQKQQIKKQYAKAVRTGGVKSAKTAADHTKKATRKTAEFVTRHWKGVVLLIAALLLLIMTAAGVSSCSSLFSGLMNGVLGTSYTSEDSDLVAVENNYAAMENELQQRIDNIERDYPGYDEYRYDLDNIGHNPHALASYLTALLQSYTPQSAQDELERIFDMQYTLTLTEEVEIRYRTETSTDPETGETTTEQVPYEYYILHVSLTNRDITTIAPEVLTAEQLQMFRVYLETSGNKPLLFGGGSADTSASEDLSGVQFVNGTRPGNPQLVELAKGQVGNVGGAPYWSWYGFDSRVAWCACFVSWCYGQAGLSEPRFAACQSQGVPWFTSHGQWGARGYENIAPGDAIFFDWDLDGSADHVGLVIGTDGNRVYTVEGNSGDACKIKSYPLDYACIKGYGLMNWN